MTNDLLLIDTLAQNIKTKIAAINAAYVTKLYDTTISLVRGKYGFNILPTEFSTREFSGVSSLPDILLDMFCYYTMNANEVRDTQWTTFLGVVNSVREALIVKAGIPSPMATVKIDVNFHDDILEQKTGSRAINGVMSFTYKKYAYNA